MPYLSKPKEIASTSLDETRKEKAGEKVCQSGGAVRSEETSRDVKGKEGDKRGRKTDRERRLKACGIKKIKKKGG